MAESKSVPKPLQKHLIKKKDKKHPQNQPKPTNQKKTKQRKKKKASYNEQCLLKFS